MGGRRVRCCAQHARLQGETILWTKMTAARRRRHHWEEEEGGGGAPIEPSASNATGHASIQTQSLSSLLLSLSALASLLALVLAPAVQRQLLGLRLPPPPCHPPFDHRQKGISNDNGSVDEARDDSQTWGLALTLMHNNQMVKRAGGRQRNKRGRPT